MKKKLIYVLICLRQDNKIRIFLLLISDVVPFVFSSAESESGSQNLRASQDFGKIGCKDRKTCSCGFLIFPSLNLTY